MLHSGFYSPRPLCAPLHSLFSSSLRSVSELSDTGGCHESTGEQSEMFRVENTSLRHSRIHCISWLANLLCLWCVYGERRVRGEEFNLIVCMGARPEFSLLQSNDQFVIGLCLSLGDRQATFNTTIYPDALRMRSPSV